MPTIGTAKIAILATDGFEKVELTVPRDELKKAGATVHIISPEGDDVRSWDETDWGSTEPADLSLKDANAADYDALVLPGGQINPDKLRTIPEAVSFVKAFAESGKPLAAICHGPWLLVEADVLKGRRATSFPSIRTDLRNAGAEVVDETVVHDGNLITSRNPDDLDAFIRTIKDAVEQGASGRDAA
ncbi:type 1 glutamine amidotransferase domain-containing protein [Roseicyclus sp. F158]|uniref:Type 1 glutamine amidotransferase domain-containing protein n=1 Tax=Tropicimonas omnivorans TaxID=3075590 RepID=A0ABU3DGN8_9RHOB|nr:type 1 glutamine amidotransferase domain-containing protein [Roseicyclus sp. F158]MDT0682882.1 type 1 glutamine amidotransferase domain-containing protein [Roseicyclus sp. F158]